MRTIIIVLALVALATAAGMSFVVQAGAQEDPTLAATLDASCDGQDRPIPRGVDTLVTCTFTATNTGTAVLAVPMLYFVPSASVPPPERYYFWSYTLDGVRWPSSGGDTAYAFSQIAPGESSTAEVQIIIRATGPYGADVQLGPGLDQVTLVNNVSESPPPARVPTLKLEPVTVEPRAEPGSARFNVMVTNPNDDPVRSASVEVDPGYDFTIRTGAWAGVEGTSHFEHRYGEIPPSIGFGEVATLQSLSDNCLYASPVAVATFQYDDGVVRVPALVEDVSPARCDSVGLVPSALPQGGFGPDAASVESAVTLIAMITGILGFATIGWAIFLVR